jgi:lipoate-protein ligase A
VDAVPPDRGLTPTPAAEPAGWDLRRLRGPAGELHAEAVPPAPGRAVWVLEAAAPALVLGSTQGDDLVDREAAGRLGVEVVRRRSGGGVVLVEPGGTLWVDLIVPAGDPLWDDDVGRAAGWVGRAWQAALAEVGVAPTEVHEGALACGPLGRLVCFATVGAGEVTLPDRRKVVGVSQRRTRAAARFQCAAYTRWHPDPLTPLLRLDESGTRAVTDAAAGTGVAPADLLAALLRHLPAGDLASPGW